MQCKKKQKKLTEVSCGDVTAWTVVYTSCDCMLRLSAAAMAAIAAAAAVGIERSSENCGNVRGHLTRSRDVPFPGKSITPRVITCAKNMLEM